MKEFWRGCREICIACIGLTPAVWAIGVIAFLLNPHLWLEFLIICIAWPVFWFIFGVGFSFAEGD